MSNFSINSPKSRTCALKLLTLILIGSIIIACRSGHESSVSDAIVIEGDLSFKLLEFGSFYALADGLEDKIFHLIDSLEALPSSTLSEDEQELLRMVNLLKDNNLLFSPSFNLRTDEGNYRVYLDSQEYDQIKLFKREDLVRENMKIKIRLKGQPVATDLKEAPQLFRCLQILSIEKVPGKTYWRK